MNAADSLVLECLVSRAGFAGHQVEHLRRWWRAVSQDETLLAFLQRQGLLSVPSVQIFQQMAQGNLTRTMGFTLLDPEELTQIRRRLPEVATLDENDTQMTMSLLGADETAPELKRLEASDQPPQVGKYLGKYLLTEWLGKGASGHVFKALHPTLQIPVAIKVLSPSIASVGPEWFERLQTEAQLLAQLNHPNVVRVFDFDAHPQHPFLVLEYVNGPSLAELIEQSGRLQPDRVIRMTIQLSEALSMAHALGIIHRDIKPANVLLTRSGEVKLADLGLAIARKFPPSPGAVRPSDWDSRAGTVLYIAPEIISSARPADERSDIYSLGATLYHALTGQPPFSGDDIWQVMEQAVKSAPPDPRSIAPEIPEDLARLVLRMLAKDPADRPASVGEIRQHAALTGSSSPPKPIGTTLWIKLMDRWRSRHQRPINRG